MTSLTLQLLEEERTPRDILVGLYELTKRAQKAHPKAAEQKKENALWGIVLDTDSATFDVAKDGVAIMVEEDDYCGRGCRCYIGTRRETLVFPDKLVEAYEQVHTHYANYTEDECNEFTKASFEMLHSQFIESIKGK